MAARSEVRTEVEGRLLTLTNLDKVLYPTHGFTKGEVIDYYLRVAGTILPHLESRALTRVRFPDGVGAGAFSFYEKNLPPGCPDWVARRRVTGSEGEITYLVADSTPALVYLANLAALEMHVPQWRFPPDPSQDPLPLGDPDRSPRSATLVVDLDPGEGLEAERLAYAAQLVGGLLATDGLLPLAKSSGSKGLQVYAAIAPTRGSQVVAYARSLGEQLVRREPDLFVGTVTVADRAKKVYLDYNQNLTGRNTVAPYSLRGREFPGVSTPLTWDEVAAIRRPEDFRFGPSDVLDRIKDHGDLLADLIDPVDPPPIPSGD